MKEKLRALLNLLKEKLSPLLAKLKRNPDAVPDKIRRPSRSLKILKYTSISLVLILGSVIAALTYYIKKNDPDQHREWVLNRLNQWIPSEEISLRSISWTLSFSDVSFGLRLKDLTFTRARSFERIHFPNLRVSVNFWGAIVSGDPVHIVADDPEIFLRKEIAAAGSRRDREQKVEEILGKWPKFFSSLLRRGSGFQFDIMNGALTVTDESSEELGRQIFRMKGLRLDARFGGFPGSADIKVSSELQVEDDSHQLVLLGPWSGRLKGRSSGSSGSIYALQIDSAEIDLSEVNFSAHSYFEKSAKNPLSVEFRGNLQFKDTIFLSPIDSLELLDGKLNYNPLLFTFELRKASESPEFALTWNLPKASRKGVYLPFKGLRSVSTEGVLDSTGTMIIDQRPNSSSGRWRIGINNLRVDMNEFGGEFAIENAGGHFFFSTIFEGEMQGSRVRSPKAEIHIDATPTRFSLASGEFSKPIGDTMNLSARLSVDRHTLLFRDVKFLMNTLDLDATGEWVNYLADPGRSEKRNLSLAFKTNRVNLSDWSSYLQSFRSVPLQGFVEAAGGFVVDTRDLSFELDEVEWRLDRMNFTNLRGSLDDLAFSRSKIFNIHHQLVTGPFSGNLVFVGRGKGWIADRVKAMGHVDLREAVLTLSDDFRKPIGVPAELNFSIEQFRNRAEIRSARLVLNDLELDLQGSLLRGSPNSRVRVVTKTPMNFENWLKFSDHSEKPSRITRGVARWSGSLLLPAKLSMEEDFDWRDVAVKGSLEGRNVEIKVDGLESPVLINEGRVSFDDNLIAAPSIRFSHAGKKGSLSLELRPREEVKRQLGLMEILKNESWSARGSLDLESLDLTKSFGPGDQEQLKFPNLLSLPVVIPPALFKNSYARESRLDFKLAVKDLLSWGSPMKNFVGEIDWNGRILRIPRFAVNGWGGSIRGNFLSDFSMMYDREDPPRHSATIELRKVSWTEFEKNLFSEGGLLVGSGVLGGQLTFTAEGLTGLEWKKTLRARIEGDLSNVRSPIAANLPTAMGDAFSSREIRDYALKDMSKNACTSPITQAKIDLQISPEGTRFDLLRLWTTNGNRLDLSGLSDSEGTMGLSGKFNGSTRCLRGDLRYCLKSLKGSDAISLKVRGSAEKPELAFLNLPRPSDLRACIADQVSARVQAEILKEGPISGQGQTTR